VFFTLDHEGYITRWNDGAKRLYGYDADEVLGDHLSTLSTDANRQKNVPEELLDTAWKDGSATNEGYLLRKDGCRFRAEVTISAGYDKDGTLRGFGVVTREATEPATERKEREEQLRQTKAKLEALFQESPDLINFHDIDGNIFDPNPELCAETGYDATELTDMKVWELDQSIDPEAVCALWRSMEPGDRRRLEGVYQRKDGSTFPVEVHIRHLRSNEEDLFVVIARDITDRKARERKLEGQNEQLEEFAGVVSHDIRNPLRNAQGRLELVREECDSEHIDPIDRSLTRIDTLIDDLLSLARDGDRLSETEPVDLAELSEECWRTVETADATVQAPIDRTVHADKSRLAQLLENLFRNAVEHAGKEVTIRVGELDSESGFYVEDDGPGIPEDERESVFDAGYTSAPEGTGFGLSIVEQVAEAHGWDVRVTDGNAGGARFDITGVKFVE
jgi:PAS domain S-box-containing protein